MMLSQQLFAENAASKAHLYESASEDIDVALGTVSSTDSAAPGKHKRSILGGLQASNFKGDRQLRNARSNQRIA
jgi:hypothetical protein